jgi:hypothetical protein
MLTLTSVRRKIALAVIVAFSALAGSLMTGIALADQGNMENALASLHSAYSSLQAATPDKGGHRGRAMGLINQAINQVNMGINYANHHGG